MDTFENKTVLITGATGLIGSHLTDTFMAMGNTKVIALSRSTEKLETCFRKYQTSANFRYIAQDVSMPLSFNDEKIDYIFHAAGSIEGQIIRDYPLSVINANIEGTKNCCDFLKHQEEKKQHKGRIVIFSSETVYGHNLSSERIVNEEDTEFTYKLNAANAAYSQSKRMTEVIAGAYCRQYNVDAVIIRPGYVYGYTAFPPNTAFYEIIKNCLKGENVIFNNNEFSWRDNIYVKDAVEGIKIACLKGKSGESYNVSSNGELNNYSSIDEIAKKIISFTNKNKASFMKHDVEFIQKDGKDIVHNPGIKMNNAKLKALGWTITTDLEKGVENTIQLFREQHIKLEQCE